MFGEEHTHCSVNCMYLQKAWTVHFLHISCCTTCPTGHCTGHSTQLVSCPGLVTWPGHDRDMTWHGHQLCTLHWSSVAHSLLSPSRQVQSDLHKLGTGSGRPTSRQRRRRRPCIHSNTSSVLLCLYICFNRAFWESGMVQKHLSYTYQTFLHSKKSRNFWNRERESLCSRPLALKKNTGKKTK